MKPPMNFLALNPTVVEPSLTVSALRSSPKGRRAKDEIGKKMFWAIVLQEEVEETKYYLIEVRAFSSTVL